MPHDRLTCDFCGYTSDASQRFKSEMKIKNGMGAIAFVRDDRPLNICFTCRFYIDEHVVDIIEARLALRKLGTIPGSSDVAKNKNQRQPD